MDSPNRERIVPTHPLSEAVSSAMSLPLLSCCILNKPTEKARVSKRENRSESSPFVESFPGHWFVTKRVKVRLNF